MRILFISNFYPPYELGGWEQLCREIVDGMSARGHTVAVLTSRYGAVQASLAEPHVHRELFLESDPYHYRPLQIVSHLLWRDTHNLKCLQDVIAEFEPDIVSIWGMWLLNPQLAVLAEKLCPGRVAYYMAGFWPVNDFEGDPHTAYWSLSSSSPWVSFLKWPVRQIVRRVLQKRRPLKPQFAHVACVSQFVLDELRRCGLRLPAGRVIYNGIDLSRFANENPRRHAQKRSEEPLRLVFVGTISPQKGTDVAVEAIAKLAGRYSPRQVHLTIIGTGLKEFVDRLKGIVREKQLTDYITFSGWVARDALPQRLKDFDVMLFTSSWQEPLARTMMEGMAGGLTLVSTTTGGSSEFLRHDVNALTFAAGDPDDLAAQVVRLLQEPGLADRLAAAGEKTALDCFDFNRMAGEIEAFLGELL